MPATPTGPATIVAMATAPGRAGVAVLRLSGKGLRALAQQLCAVTPEPRHAHHVRFRDQYGEVLDTGVLLWFPAPHSYTGEDVLELHTHGGDVAPRRVLDACLALGARHAQPGEFTRRAFERGKLDLSQAEAVADLIDAGGTAAARGAVRSLTGSFARSVRALQAQLTEVRVRLEGSIDFPEESLPAVSRRGAQEGLTRALAALAALLDEAARSEQVRRGQRVVLLGAPNVGKSSLLNRLAQEDLAIVSAEPGTTRDALRSHLELRGVRLELVDTAGVREGAQAVEKLGIARTWDAVAAADLVLQLHAFDQAGAPELRAADASAIPTLQVWNKVDLLSAEQRAAARLAHPQAVLVSAASGEGMAELEAAILRALGLGEGFEAGFLARARHVEGLRAAQIHVMAGRGLLDGVEVQEELVAEELRLAQRALDGLLGEFASDALLGEIFSRFCIGK